MPAILPTYEHGPISLPVAEHVEGGQFVEARAGGLVGVAAAGSAVVIGVAQTRAYPSTDPAVVPNGTLAFGNPFVVAPVPGPLVSVFIAGVIPGIIFSGAAAFGAKLKIGTAGGVTPWISGTDAADLQVGICFSQAGVVAGAVGLVKLR